MLRHRPLSLRARFGLALAALLVWGVALAGFIDLGKMATFW